MPNLGSGVPNNVSVTPVPLQVFTPTPSVQASCRFYNPGPSVVYIGGSNVSPSTGLPVLPGNRPVELQNVNVNLYACSGTSSQVATTTISGASAAGTTGFTVAASLASMIVGAFVQVGNGTSAEWLQVVTVSASGLTITTTKTLYDHATGNTIATVAATPGPLSVTAGVI